MQGNQDNMQDRDPWGPRLRTTRLITQMTCFINISYQNKMGQKRKKSLKSICFQQKNMIHSAQMIS